MTSDPRQSNGSFSPIPKAITSPLFKELLAGQTGNLDRRHPIRIITGNANPRLAQDISTHLRLNLHPCNVSKFANGEINIKIQEKVRGDDVFIVQSMCAGETQEINTSVMELLLLIHTARLASARRITAVVPYYAYSRQDRKTESRVPISASAIARLIQEMGADRVYTVDLHCGQIQGFFHNTPLDNLMVYPELVKYIQRKGCDPQRTVIVSPDAGGVERAKNVANLLMAHHVVTILKRRSEAGKIDSMQTVGDVKGFTCYLIDDIVDTGNTLVSAVNLLKEMGAEKVIAFATHGILTEPCCERINSCAGLIEVVVTDSIPQGEHQQRCRKLKVLPLASLIAEAILRVNNEMSISEMF
ncbi:phosphoribosylpyrophosphate synthetase [Perkinsela sp. CCAP 1560/4]|nr:phosphoribosylpyrophosphate synthetase [Perkinsela sp. CCAP 1560/4]|eukprot:KNH05604.1 phosphoribosylpyrophosphate synthetase [Perkinsela sp. CCAP 1560/4]